MAVKRTRESLVLRIMSRAANTAMLLGSAVSVVHADTVKLMVTENLAEGILKVQQTNGVGVTSNVCGFPKTAACKIPIALPVSMKGDANFPEAARPDGMSDSMGFGKLGLVDGITGFGSDGPMTGNVTDDGDADTETAKAKTAIGGDAEVTLISPSEKSSQPSGQSTGGKTDHSLFFDAATGTLSLSPFAISSAYIANGVGPLSTSRVDPIFSGDPILGATLSFNSLNLDTMFFEDGVGKFLFDSPDGMVTIAQGTNTFLTALAPEMVFDPTLPTPFYAPLTDITLNTTLGSTFIDQLQSRLNNPNELPFDLFISPSVDFGQATNNFNTSASTAADAGIAQNIIVTIPEPSTCLPLAGLLVLFWRKLQSAH